MMPKKSALRRKITVLIAAGLIVPALFTATVHAADGKVAVQWFGQSAFKITSAEGKVIMVDPFLTNNPKTPAEHKDLAALGKVDLILVTHAHGDHVGDGPALAKMHQAPMYGPAGLNDSLTALGELPKELAARFAIPMHYATFPMLTGTPEEYRHSLGETATKVLSLEPGEVASF